MKAEWQEWPKINYRLWVRMMCPCGATSSNKGTTALQGADNGDTVHVWAQAAHRNSQYFPFKCALTLKLLWQIKLINFLKLNGKLQAERKHIQHINRFNIITYSTKDFAPNTWVAKNRFKRIKHPDQCASVGGASSRKAKGP